MINDFCIIGTGPTGLTLAWILSNYGYKVTMIDREYTIGGCHRVRRVDDYFTEHGPRVYSDAYVNFITLLKKMNINFEDFFIPYNFDITTIGGKSIKDMKLFEIFWFGIEIFRMYFYPKFSIGISCLEYMKSKNFTTKTIDYVDRVCRLTDGAGADRYTLFEFLQNFNQNVPYSLYQPKKPNDIGLFKNFKTKLEKKGVKFILDTQIIQLKENNGKITEIITNKGSNNLKAKNFIMAIPPKNLIKILNNSNENIKNSFGNFNQLSKWTEETNYNVYITLILHWNRKIELANIWGFPLSDWGIAFIVLSDYMDFKEENSKLVISCAITKTNNKSKVTGKTAMESNEVEIKKEVFRELKELFPNITKPNKIIISPGDNKINNNWDTKDNAFLMTPSVVNGYPIQLQSNKYPNLYSVGTHNGFTRYHFTSMESAVTNAFKLAHLLIPESTKEYPIKSPFSLINWLVKFIFIIILIVIIKLFV